MEWNIFFNSKCCLMPAYGIRAGHSHNVTSHKQGMEVMEDMEDRDVKQSMDGTVSCEGEVLYFAAPYLCANGHVTFM